MAHALEVLRTVDDVAEVHFTCPGTVLASDRLCADVVMKDGARLRFERVGFNSFGSTAMNVFVSKASGLAPRITSCGGVSSPNFHRTGPLGHHFQPTLIDMKDAVSRYEELLEEVEYLAAVPAILGGAGPARAEFPLLCATGRFHRRTAAPRRLPVARVTLRG